MANQNKNPLDLAAAANAAAISAQKNADLAKSYASKAAQQAAFAQSILNQAHRSNLPLWKGTWASGVVYSINDFVDHSGISYLSLISNNVGHTPGSSPSQWQPLGAGGGGTVVTHEGVAGDGSSGDPVGLAHISSGKILGRHSAGTGAVEYLSGSDLAAIIDVATPSAAGTMSASDKSKLNTLPLPWLPVTERYVAATGDDANSGTDPTHAFATIAAGLQALASAGGGTLYVDDGCAANANPAYGIWVRGDTFAVPGFINIPSVPIRIVGTGKTQGVGPFLSGPQSKFTGGAGRHAPNLWVVGPLNSPFRVEYLQHQFPHHVGARIGVDYDRNPDGSERAIAVASATRTGTTTVYTLTLPAGVPITSASRTSGVTTLVIPNPSGLPWPFFKGGGVVRIASANGDFPSGDYTVTVTSNFVTSPIPTTWTVSYSDPGPDKSTESMTGSTLQSHGCVPGDFIDLTSTSGAFFGTQYEVTAIDATTVTVTDVFDPFHVGDFTDTNIGTITHQERFAGGTSMFEAYKCGFSCDQTDTLAGPSWDIGHTAAIPPLLDSCWHAGYVGDGTGPRDEERMAGVFVCGGSSGSLGPVFGAITARHSRGAAGSIYVKTSSNGAVDVRDELVETAGFYQALGLPALRVVGTVYTTVFGQDISNADSTNTTVILQGVPSTGAWLERCGTVSGSCIGGDSFQTPSAWAAQNGTGTNNPWTNDQAAYWADLRLAAKHPGAPRAMGVVGARFANVIAPPGSWSIAGTLTTGIEAPDGSLTAVQIDSPLTNYQVVKGNAPDGATWAVGGYFVFCGWVNMLTANGFDTSDGVRVITSDITFEPHNGGAFSMPFPYFGHGWQFVSMKLKVASVASSSPTYELAILTLGTTQCQFWGLTAHYVPNTFHINDIAEYMGTLKHQPYYLSKGMSGTMEGIKLIAHGGLGVDVSVPSSSALPLFAADGTTVQAHIPLIGPRAGSDLTDADATVNPATDAASVYTLPASTLSANRVLTLGVSGSPTTKSVVQIVRRDLSAHTYEVKDDASTSLFIFPSGPASPQGVSFYFDGSHFQILSFYYVN